MIASLCQLHRQINTFNCAGRRRSSLNTKCGHNERQMRIANYKLEYEVKNSTWGERNFIIIRNHRKEKTEDDEILSKWYRNEIIMSFCLSRLSFLLICRHMPWRSMIFKADWGLLKVIVKTRDNNKAWAERPTTVFIFGLSGDFRSALAWLGGGATAKSMMKDLTLGVTSHID